MSHKATNWLASLPPETLTHAEFRVLFHLCDCHNPSFGCFPEQKYLRANASLSNGGLNNALLSLEEKGLIRREKQHDVESGQRQATRYLLGFEVDISVSPTPLNGVGSISTFKGGPSPLLGGGHLHIGGVVYKDKPVKEPVKEPVTREASFFSEEKMDETPRDDGFSAFWEAYPKCQRKTGKPQAHAVWLRIIAGKAKDIPQTAANVMIAAAERYAATRPDPQFVPMPATWLNGSRWDQFLTAPAERRSQYFGEIVQ